MLTILQMTFFFFYLMQKSPQHRQIVSSVILLHIMREAEQRNLLPAAPQWRTVDQRCLWEQSQEETRVPKQELHDGVGGDAGVGPDECVDFLELSIQVLGWESDEAQNVVLWHERGYFAFIRRNKVKSCVFLFHLKLWRDDAVAHFYFPQVSNIFGGEMAVLIRPCNARSVIKSTR